MPSKFFAALRITHSTAALLAAAGRTLPRT